jgi:diguanylate cyclase (GGDEF)-like protein
MTTGMGVGQPSRLWLGWLIAGCVAAGGFHLLPAGHWSGAIYTGAFSVACNVMLFVGLRRHRPERRALWYLFGAGQLLWTVGDIIFSVHIHVLHVEPYPSVADFIYLAGYPVLVAAVFLLIRGRTGTPDRNGLIDAGIVATGATLLAWTYLIRPITEDIAMTVPERTISVAYPAGDLLLLVMAARLFTTQGVRTVSYWMLAGALVSVLAADTIFSGLISLHSYENLTAVADTGWMLSYLAWACAALHPSMVELSQPHPGRATRFARLRLILLAATSLLAPAVLIHQGLTAPDEIDWPAIGTGAGILSLLVVTRMAGLVAQIQDQAALLAALAHNDSLTGIPNRRAWDLELAREMSRARRTGRPVVVALLDLDHFKRFNDAHGHQLGDRLLRDAAAVWNAHMRSGDLLARYGGEEFGAIITGVPLSEAAEIVDRLRGLTPLGQTFSAGIACWDGQETVEQLISRVDEALYAAKHAGRNRVYANPPLVLAPV